MESELGRCPTFARLRMLLDRQPSDLWLGASGSRMRFENSGNVFLGSEVDLTSGLYRKEQLEIGAQEARKRRPDLSGDALFELAVENCDPSSRSPLMT